MKKKVALLLAGLTCVGCASACGGGSSGKLATSKWGEAVEKVNHDYWSQVATYEEWYNGERFTKTRVEALYRENITKGTITDYSIDENGDEIVETRVGYSVYEDGVCYTYDRRGEEEIDGVMVDIYGWEAKMEESDFQETFDQAISTIETMLMMADFYNYGNGYYYFEMNQGAVLTRSEFEFDGSAAKMRIYNDGNNNQVPTLHFTTAGDLWNGGTKAEVTVQYQLESGEWVTLGSYSNYAVCRI